MKGTTLDNVKEHLRCHNIEIRELTITSHQEAKFTSFKLTVPISEMNKVIDPENWPSGISVRRYFNRHQTSNPTDSRDQDRQNQMRDHLHSDNVIDRDDEGDVDI